MQSLPPIQNCASGLLHLAAAASPPELCLWGLGMGNVSKKRLARGWDASNGWPRTSRPPLRKPLRSLSGMPKATGLSLSLAVMSVSDKSCADPLDDYKDVQLSRGVSCKSFCISRSN